MTYLIDTDYLVDYLKGYKAATMVLTTIQSEGIGMSIISFGEVYEGIYYGYNRVQHEKGFRGLLTHIPVVSLSRPVARTFATIRGDLRRRGLLIPDPDLYIAATALHHNLTLVTRNIKDYIRIPNLKLYQPEHNVAL
jgi:tRNA(fMet)-specific endonuclease VapC